MSFIFKGFKVKSGAVKKEKKLYDSKVSQSFLLKIKRTASLGEWMAIENLIQTVLSFSTLNYKGKSLILKF